MVKSRYLSKYQIDQDDFILALDMKLSQNIEPPEIIVIAKVARNVTDGGGLGQAGFSLIPFLYGRDYGEGTFNSDPFEFKPIALNLAPHEIVARAAEALTKAIKFAIDLARPVLSSGEELRLDTLSEGLERAALGLKAGDLDLGSAKSTIATSLGIAFDTMSGAGLGIVFGAMGSVASSLTACPQLKAIGTFGFAMVGVAMDWMLSDTKAAQNLANVLTDALFDGAQKFSDVFNDMMNDLANGIDILTKQNLQMPGSFLLELQTDGIYGEFDGQTSNGYEYNISVTHGNVNVGYVISTNDVLVIPGSWPGYSGPGPKTPPMHEPPPASQPMDIIMNVISPEINELSLIF